MARIKKLFHIALGFTLILIGLLGLILPILNGVIFLLLGFILLSFQSQYVEQRLSRIAHKNSVLGEWYEKLDSWMRRIFG